MPAHSSAAAASLRAAAICPRRPPRIARALRPAPCPRWTPTWSCESVLAAPTAPASTRPLLLARLAQAIGGQLFVIHTQHLDVDVEAVHQRARDALLVALDHAQRETNAVRMHLTFWITKVAARTGILWRSRNLPSDRSRASSWYVYRGTEHASHQRLHVTHQRRRPSVLDHDTEQVSEQM
jgi:hypothetical protein